MRAATIAAGALVLSTMACQRQSASTGYRGEIEAFRRAREAKLTSDTGWLTIAGLFFLSKPESTFGSDPQNDIVLPAGAPSRAGTFFLRDGHVAVKAADGVSFVLDDRTIRDGELASDNPGPPDRISLGDLTLWVHQSGDRLAIRLRDKNNQLRKAFIGLSWFDVNDAYRVEGTFTPFEEPKMVEVPNLLGDVETMTSPGTVAFTLGGRPLSLAVVTENDREFWFIFRDLTSGAETYPAVRFLYTPRPVNGKVTLDFNKAENPPCAYNPYATCPLPPPENRLPVRIEAGEKNYTGHS